MNVIVFLLAFTGAQDRPAAPGHWPQWRGPDRENVCAERGLLPAWTEGEPRLLWKSTELGDGFPPVSVAGGRIYGLGYRDRSEFVTALDGAGAVVWSQPIGPQSGEYPAMRFLSQRSITVDDTLLYAFTSAGVLLCLRSADGQIIWKKDYVRDFGGRPTSFFYADAPLVDGELLICKPGGQNGTLAALNRKTGALVWRSKELRDNAAHAPVIAAEIGGVRQYVVLTMESVAGIVAKTGAVAWRAERRGQTAVAPTPIYHDGIVFVTSGFNVGCNAFRVTANHGQCIVEPLYSGKQMSNHRGGVVHLGGYVYGTDESQLKCIDLKTGTVVWQDRCVGKGSVTLADGNLIVRGERGTVALVEATPAGYCETGRLDPPEKSSEPTLSQPVVAGGRLYLRDMAVLTCYDLRGRDYKEPAPFWNTPPSDAKPPTQSTPGGPDAAFVPTPQDVVDQMIQLAKVTKDDVVYDLGSGDGRIVLTASRVHGCKSVGFELNPGLVRKSRFKAKQAKLDSLVAIEEKDLFTVDLSPASVITLYLGAPNNAKLLPALEKLKPGSRIISHAHLLGDSGPKPDQTVKITSKEDQEEHTIYVWKTPLKNDGK